MCEMYIQISDIKVNEECLHIREGFSLHKSLRNGQVMSTSLSLLGNKPPTLQPLEWQTHLRDSIIRQGFPQPQGNALQNHLILLF